MKREIKRFRLYLCATSAAFAIHAAMPAWSAQNSDTVSDFDIPEQSLESALNAFGTMSQSQLMYSREIVQGRVSQPLQGELPRDKALQQLLGDTGLTYEETESGVILIRSAQAANSTQYVSAMQYAQAQDAPAAVETVPSQRNGAASSERPTQSADIITVTGSRISTGLDTPLSSPLELVSRDELTGANRATIGQFVITSTLNSGSFHNNEQSSQSDSTATAFNLRGLGVRSTLVLINGQRQVDTPEPGKKNITMVDVNSLMPSIMVQRLEILKDGAAALYGSEAVAGVMNFITRDKFEGFEIDSNWQRAQFGGKDDVSAQAIWGMQGARGGVVTAIEFQKRDPNFLDNRFSDRIFNYGATSSFSTPGSFITSAGRVPDPLCGSPALDNLAADLYPGVTGENPVSIIDGDRCIRIFAQGRGYNSKETRLNAMMRAHYDVSDSFETHFEAGVSRGRFQRFTQAVPTAFPRTSRAASTVPVSNPGNVFGEEVVATFQRGILNGNPSVGLREGPGQLETDYFRLNSGFDYRPFESNFLIEGDVTWATSDSQVRRSDVIEERWAAALNGYGGPDCDPSAGMPGVGNCGYFNPFASAFLASPGDPEYNDPDLVKWVAPELVQDGRTELFTAELVASTPLFELPGGMLGAAVGFQYRDESWRRYVSELSKYPGFVFQGREVDAEGDRDAISAFFELRAPILESLELSVAGRYEDFGGRLNSFDPKVGVVWQPVDDLTLRASWGTAFRTPSLNQVYGTRIGAVNVTVDPVTGEQDTVQSIEQGGDVDPEESTSYNIGADYNWNGFSFTADFWNYDFTGIAIQLDPELLIQNDPTSPLIVRDGTGRPIQITLPIINASSVKTNGVDFKLGYETDLGDWAQLSLKTSTSFVNKYEYQEELNGPLIDGVGYRNDTSGVAEPLPRWRGNYTAALNFGPNYNYRAAVTTRLVSTVVDRQNESVDDNFVTVDLALSATLENLLGSGSPDSNTVVRFGVNNLFNEAPPLIIGSLFTFDERSYDGTGRQFVLGLTHKF